MYGLWSAPRNSSVRLYVAMRQQVLCHCNFLEPGSVGASNLGHPSLVVFSVLSKSRWSCRCSGLFAKLLFSGSFFSASPPRGDPSFCRGYKKMLHKEPNRNLMPRDPTEIGAEHHPTDDEFYCISVGCFIFDRWDGGCGGIGRASHMVILVFAFPLAARVVLWTSRMAITASEAKQTKGY